MTKLLLLACLVSGYAQANNTEDFSARVERAKSRLYKESITDLNKRNLLAGMLVFSVLEDVCDDITAKSAEAAEGCRRILLAQKEIYAAFDAYMLEQEAKEYTPQA